MFSDSFHVGSFPRNLFESVVFESVLRKVFSNVAVSIFRCLVVGKLSSNVFEICRSNAFSNVFFGSSFRFFVRQLFVSNVLFILLSVFFRKCFEGCSKVVFFESVFERLLSMFLESCSNVLFRTFLERNF